MSEKKWTDDELQAYLSALDKQLSEGATKLDFEFISHAGRFAWEWEYHLRYQEEKIRLSLPQAQMVENWVQAHHKHPEQKSERDTHFAHFAYMLLDDLFDIWHHSYVDFARFDEPECLAVQQLFARRAYDLMIHTLYHSRYDREVPSVSIPDMTAWPEESE